MCCICEDQKHVAYEDTLTPEEIAYYDDVWKKLQKYVQYKDMQPKYIQVSLKGKIDYNKILELINNELDKIEYNTYFMVDFEIGKNRNKIAHLQCKVCGETKKYSIQEMKRVDGKGGVPRCFCNFQKQTKKMNTKAMYLKYMIAKKMGITCFLLPNQTWVNNKFELQWFDKNNHFFKRSWNNVINGNWNCLDCARIITGNAHRKTIEKYKKDLFEIHGNKIEVLGEYQNTHKKTKHKCNVCGNIWFPKPHDILSDKTGCPKCASSKMEKETSAFAKKYSITEEIQKYFKDCKDINHLPFDHSFFDKNGDLALVIECNGEHHYMEIDYGNGRVSDLNDRIKKDNIKATYCIENNIPLCIIPYWEKGNIENYLLNHPSTHIREIIHKLIGGKKI